VSLLLVSLDQLKAVNDAYGPRLADRLLEESAARIFDSVSIGDLVGSVGGGEFAIVLPPTDRFEDSVSVARRVLAALLPPCDFGGERVYCAASIGIASYPVDGDSAQRIFQNASIALSRARAGRGDGYRVFKPEMQALAAGRMQLESALRGALERGEFVVHYQPRFDTASGMAVGFEALLRWNHPERGLLPPGNSSRCSRRPAPSARSASGSSAAPASRSGSGRTRACSRCPSR
jgi:diguanylate cyclase (GGDEF)-like protein